MTEAEQKISTYIDSERENMLVFWKELVSHESGSACKDDLDRTRDFLMQSFASAGAEVETVPYEKAGDLLIATFNSHAAEAPIILSGHYDTVFKHGTIEERPFRIEAGKAYGPGALDMKGGITMLFFVIKALLAGGYTERPLKVVLAGDEEVGHQFSAAAEDFKKAVHGGRAAFNFETGYLDNGFVTGRKGGANAFFACHGIGAHAGNEPEKGRSAILELANKTVEIQALTDFAAGITYNVGVFAGGTVPNAVPEEAKIVVDIRYKETKQLDQIKEDLEKILNKTWVEGTKTEMRLAVSMPPMETTDKVKELFSVLQETAAEIGFGEISQKYVGGGADSSYEAQMGLPVMCAVGVAGGKNHTVEEFADVESLFSRAKLVASTIARL